MKLNSMPTANSYICDLTPYQPGLSIEQVARRYSLAEADIIKLASNENPHGASPLVLQAVEATAKYGHRYPEQHKLIEALSRHFSVSEDCLVLGNGSNDILDIIARTFLSKGDEAIMTRYSFAAYPIATQTTGAKLVAVPDQDFNHDLVALRQAVTPATKIIWLANPNNPTGTFTPYNQIKRFLTKVPLGVIVVLDEAYCEYLPDDERIDTTKWLHEHPNLILVRTFSKIYGLAGLRIGYGIATSEIAALLKRVRLPFNANSLALAAATAALEDQAFVSVSRSANSAGLDQLKEGLDGLDIDYLPSWGNFITITVPDADRINQRLLEAGIIVRPISAYGLTNYLRISVGMPEENERFLTTLKQVA